MCYEHIGFGREWCEYDWSSVGFELSPIQILRVAFKEIIAALLHIQKILYYVIILIQLNHWYSSVDWSVFLTLNQLFFRKVIVLHISSDIAAVENCYICAQDYLIHQKYFYTKIKL